MATGVQLVAVDCPGCLLQISGGLDSRGSAVIVRHTAEILAGNIDDSVTQPAAALNAEKH